MVVKWVTIKPVLARIVRNIRDVDGDYLADLPEWIAEAIAKLKTHYQLELKFEKIDIRFHIGKLPCQIDALAAVIYRGQRLMPGDPAGPLRVPSNTANSAFVSILNSPGGSKDIEETDVNDWPFYLNTVEEVALMPISSDTYRINYNKIETSVKDGQLGIWFWRVPCDSEGLPMVPDNENFKTAVYWYARMMMIGAGYEDKVFSYDKCDYNFNLYGERAINEITYPTPDEKQKTIQNTVSLIPHLYDWELFGGGGPEAAFNDDLI